MKMTKVVVVRVIRTSFTRKRERKNEVSLVKVSNNGEKCSKVAAANSVSYSESSCSRWSS